jgi:hypothetical protein
LDIFAVGGLKFLLLLFFRVAIKIFKADPVFVKKEIDDAGRAVSMFGNVDFRDIFFFRRYFAEIPVHGFAVNKQNHVGVLFD